MSYKVEILDFVDRISVFLSEYVKTQLKEPAVLDIVSQIINESGKSPGDALIVFVSAVKYLWGTGNAFVEMEENDSFQKFVKTSRRLLIELAVRRRQQYNIPTRAFPLIEVINKKIKDAENPVAVIELGASYGLLGWSLLEPVKIIENRDHYFLPKQKIPPSPRPIDYYLGMDIEIPDQRWLLACIWEIVSESYLRNFLNDIPYKTEKFNLMETNAFGFSDFEPVKKLASQPFTLIVLTSFMFFQIGEENEKKLKDEISKFTESTGAHWISQFVKHPPDRDARYFIEWNGEKIIESSDAICSDWEWLSD